MIVSGLDPSGGAGIQADIQAATALGVHPLPVLSCLTVQDTRNVYNAAPVDADLVRQQLDRLAADCRIDAVKTGAMGNAAVVKVVADFLDRHPDLPLIQDPVIKAAGGGDLADDELLDAMQGSLFPRAEVITPNGIELAQLGGSEEEALSARQLLDTGCQGVLATGGHGTGKVITNTLYRASQASRSWQIERVGGEYHGTGCTLAAAIGAGRAAGLSLEDAIEQAQRFVSNAINHALEVGGGQPVPDRGAPWPVNQ
ncbi:hydroxymethylpyrimidine/phosphomethylpyrimidine kinase [Marinobacter bryozoorum]|uniref:bifunctional hydroxymethylpyrimidine kinase/phosphomethylpyrimidine kinase n=1 Tax=Marinobacter bryozoorum TaxID=256324 RepID=UPI002004AC00|nr:hydroxymethylpyrimidine/phosphomethylpyrimidine kinase [Marinobacter bryozoorum]MCK7545550.1 hydroxymethylpyrimidine/phosphomethylpyrimidine kinase [Marinobacter bryozoorum]